jgi:hypothetical protein
MFERDRGAVAGGEVVCASGKIVGKVAHICADILTPRAPAPSEGNVDSGTVTVTTSPESRDPTSLRSEKLLRTLGFWCHEEPAIA